MLKQTTDQNPPTQLFTRNLVLLILCQGLFLVNNVTFIAINGLVGLSLATISWMATLPVMGYVVGGALSTSIVAKIHKSMGRRKSFQIGLGVAVISSLICAYATYSKSFELLCFGTLVAGYYSANGQLYRFAAAEVSHRSLQEKAVSWVLAGGILGAVIGPNLASWTKNYFSVQFLGAYLILSIAATIGMILMQWVDFPKDENQSEGSPTGRPLGEIIRQPIFIVAAICASLGYGVMNLLMAATPLAMQVCGLPFSDTAFVLEWHVIGMFAPGLFTGSLIKKYGAIPIMGVGVLLNLICIFTALSGVNLHHFLIGLFTLGVGWNFIFTGATTLAMRAYQANEKDITQGAINFCVFGVMAFTSFGSGALMSTQGWAWLNIGSFIPVSMIAGALIWLHFYEKRLLRQN